MDYGCGPGKSTIEVVRPAVAAFREKFPDKPVVVCHADQPKNDWNSLFDLISQPSSYVGEDTNIRTEAAVGSFYDQMATAQSVSLGTCFAASHWLSQTVPIDAPDTLWFADLQGDARAQMWEFAERDWTTFLRRRAEELQSGGYLLVSTLGSIPDENEINGVAASGRGIYRGLFEVASGMADDGLLNRDILDKFAFALWFLTAEEARNSLETDPVLKEAFEIEEVSVVPAPENPSDIFAVLIDDPAAYAKTYTGYIRAFGDSSLRLQLFEPSSSNPDQLATEFYARLEKLYQEHLSKYAFELWNLTVILRKR